MASIVKNKDTVNRPMAVVEVVDADGNESLALAAVVVNEAGEAVAAPPAAVTEDAAAAANPSGTQLMARRRDTPVTNEVSAENDVIALNATNKGELRVNDADLIAKTPALGTAGTASADVITVQGITAGTPLIVGGAVASGAADSGNPVKIGGVGSSTAPTAVTAGQRANAWFGLNGGRVISGLNTAGADATSNNLNILPDATNGTPRPLAIANFMFNGTTWDRARGDTGGAVNQPYAMSASRWNYAAASGGIVNSTTAVTIAAAGGASIRNYLVSLQVDWEALAAATEIAIRDGAGGTVLWRMKAPASVAGMREVIFPAPLKGTANTLLEIVTLTASVTGGVFVNAQGFTGA